MSTNTRHKEKIPVDFDAVLKVCEQYGISKEVISYFVVLQRRYFNE